MKYLIGLMLFMLSHIASAALAECQVDGGDWADAETTGFYVYVDVKASTSLKKVLLNYFSMNCRHKLSVDLLSSLKISTQPDAVKFSSDYSHLKGGLVSLGEYYPVPVQAGLSMGTHTTGPYISVQGGPYLDITTTPDKYINIKSGSHIASVYFKMRLSNLVLGVKNFETPVFVYARNALNLSPSTCTINDNDPINIDFGSVDPLAIGGDTSPGTPYRKSFVLNYSCPDAGISSPLDIKLVGTASSFNSKALTTTNPNLAAGLTRLSELVAPGSSFRTSITNSSGSDTVLFTLFRKAGSLPAAGPFTASGTLVMSVP